MRKRSVAFLLGSLGLLAFVAACDDVPRRQSVSLLDRLGDVGFADRGASRVVNLDGESREALAIPVGSKVVFPLQVPQNAVLQFSLAVVSEDTGRSYETEFLVETESEGRRARAFREVLTGENTNRWNDRLVDLSPWSGRSVVLILEARQLADPSAPERGEPPLATWGEPVLSSSPAQPVGRTVALFNEWHRQTKQVPSARSDPEAVGDTKFSHDRGFYKRPFEVSIATATPGATIVYTTDGSEPSPSNGNVGDRVFVDDTTVLRAMAYKDGATWTNVDTHTYIFPARVREQTTLPFDYPSPLGSYNFAPRPDLDLEIDPDIVNSRNHREFVEGLTSLPTLSVVMDVDHLFDAGRGLYFEKGELTRSASVELIYPGTFPDFEGFQVDSGIRAHSQQGHPLEKRSFRLVFNKEYGPGMLRYPFFESAVHHAESAVAEFNTIVLRGGGQANWSRAGNVGELSVYVRDQHVRDTQLWLSGASAHGIFVHLYLNGIYWGVYNAVERPDQRFLASYFGGDPATDWFAINQSGAFSTRSPRWREMHGYARDNDLSDRAKYEVMKTFLDTTRFSDYILLNWFTGMGDWGAKNWYGGIRINPPGAGLYFCWDSEITYGLFPNYGHAGAWVPPQFVAGGESALHELWRQLYESPEFRLEFADRVYRACYNGGPLMDNINKTNFQRLSNYLEPAMLCESARWGDASPGREESPRTRDEHWKQSRDYVLALMEGNVERFIQALRRHRYYPSIDPPAFETTGDQIIITRPQGAERVYYTLDGSDPRSPSAFSFADRTETVRFSPDLKGRSRSGDEWSALNEFGVWKRQ